MFIAINERLPIGTTILGLQECALKSYEDVIRPLFTEPNLLNGRWIVSKVVPQIPHVFILRTKEESVLDSTLATSPDFFIALWIDSYYSNSSPNRSPSTPNGFPGLTCVFRLCNYAHAGGVPYVTIVGTNCKVEYGLRRIPSRLRHRIPVVTVILRDVPRRRFIA